MNGNTKIAILTKLINRLNAKPIQLQQGLHGGGWREGVDWLIDWFLVKLDKLIPKFMFA